jgi:hypothetical protein
MRIWSGFVFAVGLFSAVCVTQNTFAATPACVLKLGWQPSVDPTVTGYALYYGASGEPFTNRLDVGLVTSVSMTNLMGLASYSFCVAAYDANGDESDPSNFLICTAQSISGVKLNPAQGGGMAVCFTVGPGGACHVEYTDTLTPPNWKMLTACAGDSNGVVKVVDTAVAPGGMRFYRAVVP